MDKDIKIVIRIRGFGIVNTVVNTELTSVACWYGVFIE